ncbi:MAG: hypothetical protein ACKVOG_10525 [Rhodoglobus sp.]
MSEHRCNDRAQVVGRQDAADQATGNGASDRLDLGLVCPQVGSSLTSLS